MTVGWHQHLFVNLYVFFVFGSLHLKGQTVGVGWGRGAHTLAICHMENSELVLYAVMFLQTAVMLPAHCLHKTKTQVDSHFQLASSFLKASQPLFGCAMMGVSPSAGKRKKNQGNQGISNRILVTVIILTPSNIVSANHWRIDRLIFTWQELPPPPPLWHPHLCRSTAANQIGRRLQVCWRNWDHFQWHFKWHILPHLRCNMWTDSLQPRFDTPLHQLQVVLDNHLHFPDNVCSVLFPLFVL